MADFELLAPGGHQKLVDEVEDRLDFKADIDGYYAQLTAGAADNLTGRGDATTAEFLYRTAGGTADIETGQAVAKSVKGNTMVWNQLYNKSTVATTTTNGITFTVNADGSITASGTATADTEFFLITNRSFDAHKYLVSGCPSGGSDSTYSVRMRGAGSDAIDTGSSTIWDATGNTWKNMQIRVYNGTTVDNIVFKPQLFDLTAMFGAGSEPSTIEEFTALYPLPYYEYDAGSLLSVNMAGIETTGFNQWDEEWELGAIAVATGQNVTNSNTIRSKNYDRCFPDTSYYIHGSQGIYVFWYDAEKNYISNTYTVDTIKTSPANAAYFRVRVDNITTYNHDICINLSWSGRRNGEYEPYWKSERTIPATDLRSAGAVYDEQTATERIVRVGEVDLGTLTWEYQSGNARFRTGSLSSVVEHNTSTLDYNLTCPLYTANGTTADKTMFVNTDGNIFIYDSAYTDAATFKTAMSGVMLHYALATPTVTPYDPPLNLSYRVDDFGTERIMVPENERSAPPVLDIAYGLNVVDFVRRAPTEYISAASFRQYLLARDAHDGTTTTMTWDDTDNRYEFAITDTVTEG